MMFLLQDYSSSRDGCVHLYKCILSSREENEFNSFLHKWLERQWEKHGGFDFFIIIYFKNRLLFTFQIAMS